MITTRSPLPTNIGGVPRDNLFYRAVMWIGHVDLLLVARPDGVVAGVMKQHKEGFNLIGCAPLHSPGREGVWQPLRQFAPRVIDHVAHNLAPRAKDYETDNQLSSQALQAIGKTKYDAVI